MKKAMILLVLVCSFFVLPVYAQTSVNPWEEMVFNTVSGTIPDTDRNYTVEIRFSPYGNEAYITYIIHEGLYKESDAVYAIRDVARKLTAEYGYDWYNYPAPAVLFYDNSTHTAHYRANIIFRKYLIQEDE